MSVDYVSVIINLFADRELFRVQGFPVFSVVPDAVAGIFGLLLARNRQSAFRYAHRLERGIFVVLLVLDVVQDRKRLLSQRLEGMDRDSRPVTAETSAAKLSNKLCICGTAAVYLLEDFGIRRWQSLNAGIAILNGGFWFVCADRLVDSLVLYSRSLILYSRSLVLDSRSLVLHSRSLFLDSRSLVLDSRSLILDSRSRRPTWAAWQLSLGTVVLFVQINIHCRYECNPVSKRVLAVANDAVQTQASKQA